MKKGKAAAVLLSCLVLVFTGCDTSVTSSSWASKENFVTVDGNTSGFAEKSTAGNGSASFNVSDHRVNMTNFSFDADPTSKVLASLEDDDLVFSRVIVHDGEEVFQNVCDGRYIRDITEDNVVYSFNDIYKKTMHASDSPIIPDIIQTDQQMVIAFLEIDDGMMAIMAELDTDKYITVAYTTDDHGTEDIMYNAFQALGGAAVDMVLNREAERPFG